MLKVAPVCVSGCLGFQTSQAGTYMLERFMEKCFDECVLGCLASGQVCTSY